MDSRKQVFRNESIRSNLSEIEVPDGEVSTYNIVSKRDTPSASVLTIQPVIYKSGTPSFMQRVNSNSNKSNASSQRTPNKVEYNLDNPYYRKNTGRSQTFREPGSKISPFFMSPSEYASLGRKSRPRDDLFIPGTIPNNMGFGKPLETFYAVPLDDMNKNKDEKDGKDKEGKDKDGKDANGNSDKPKDENEKTKEDKDKNEKESEAQKKDGKNEKENEKKPFYERKKYFLFNYKQSDDNATRCAACNWFTQFFYGIPMYIWAIFFTILLILLAISAWLIYSYIVTLSYNNSYFATCTSNLDCNVNMLLHCAVENSACLCPASIVKGRCDCQPGYFWNGTRCSLVMAYGESYCADDYNCDPTKYLVCTNNVCTCDKHKKWNSTALFCDFEYVNCFYEYSPIPTFQSHIGFTNFFVDMCIDQCYKMKSPYAGISYNGFTDYCYCMSSYNTTGLSTASCNVYGPGSIPTGRKIGNGIDHFYRAVYKTQI